jgi:hypothetical protein
MTQKLHNMYYTYMIEFLQSSYLPITMDTFSTHTRRYVTSTLMLGFCMNPYATSFASSPLHEIYSYYSKLFATEYTYN